MLDKDNWGVFSTLIVIVSFLTALTDLGLNYFILYAASSLSHKEPSVIRKALSAPFRYKLLSIFVIGLGMFIFANPLAVLFKLDGGAKYFVASAVFFVFLNIFSTFDLLLSGLKKFKESMFIGTLNNVLRLAAAYGLVVLGFGVDGAILGYIAAVAISTAVQVVLIRQYISLTGKAQESVANMFTYGLYFGLGNLAALISLWTDSVMIGLFMGPAAVGIYRIAVSISTAVAGLVAGMNKVLFPFLASAEGRGEESIGDLNTAIKYGSFIAFPTMIGLALSSDAVVKIFFGQQYAESAIPLLLLSYICFDMMLTSLISSYLGAKKRTKIIGFSAAASAVANVLLNLILIPLFGIVGSAVASISTRLANAVIMVEWSNRNMKAKYDLRSMVIPFAGSLLMGAFLFLVVRLFVDPSHSLLSLLVFVGTGIASYALFEQLLGFDVIVLARKVISSLLF
jgi:O-antigen/teichoic acid export membrane protein